MLRRIEVALRPSVTDTVGRKVAHKIKESLDIDAGEVSLVKVFTVDGLDKAQLERVVSEAVLSDPVLQTASLEPVKSDAAWVMEVSFRPGVTDNEGRTARDTLAMVMGIEDRRSIAVYTANQYHISAELDRATVEHIAKDLMANELIQRYAIKSREEWAAEAGFPAVASQVTGSPCDEVAVIPLSTMSDDEIMAFSRANTLALNLEEMHAIRGYYAREDVQAARTAKGLPLEPTDAEVEAMAQTWSEHCKHKIFSSLINYEDKETGKKEVINSLYKTCIQNATKTIRERLGDKDFCKSVFKDNAGVIAFTDSHDICIKVETHNSPSALDPYGGALTGIVGVNRDPMGTGMGANLVCNTDVFCFASPYWEGELPPRLLHPRRVLEGVREGVEHGGNKSGIPTVNGSLVFEDRYLGKPLVYCGTVGMIPKEVAGKPGHQKKAMPGDAIVMVGGRIGKDGIHGATFSSEELHEGSPATAVQIGDPITQRKMYDCIMRARDLGLYNAITDNGAGGLSSSVGEMAEDTGGCRLDLSKAPLKYDGLRPWEILLSEAQERMTLAVPQEKLDAFLTLAEEMDVEANALGEYTDDGYFHVMFGDKHVAYVEMDFLHDGVPQLKLNAVWERPVFDDGRIDMDDAKQAEFLKTMLGTLNICSKEYIIRQYDHEVKGGSVVKPLVGVKRDGPADAAVVRPLLDNETGVVLSHGICPKFSDFDAYWMVANTIDEAVRNAVAVGGNPDFMSGVDNFCWCDPVQSEKTPDGEYKLAQLVRANRALEDFCLAYGVPCVSGKDSMKNDYTGGGQKISIPPTVLYSVMGVIDDVNKTTTSDFKQAGNAVYLLGATKREMAGSEAATTLGITCAAVPTVDADTAMARYRALHKAIGAGLVKACHDLSDGGLAVAMAEMCLGGRMGASMDVSAIVLDGDMTLTEALYSESASRLLVEVAPENVAAFEALFAGQACACIAKTTDDATFTMKRGDATIMAEPVEELAVAFKATLNW